MSDVRGEELKMWLAVREDLAMPRGKLAVQAGHAFVQCILEAQIMDQERGSLAVRTYMGMNQPKIAVKAKNLAALQRAYDECMAAELPCVIVEDLGRTVFPEPTITVMAVGPCYANELPRFVQRLQLLKDPEPIGESPTVVD